MRNRQFVKIWLAWAPGRRYAIITIYGTGMRGFLWPLCVARGRQP